MAGSRTPVPRYHQIYMGLRQQIMDGLYDESRVPGELDLAQQYGVARVTVRRAMAELVREGLIVRRPGQGTFVDRKRVTQAAPQRLTGLLDNILDTAAHMSVLVVEFDYVPCPRDVAAELQVAPHESVLRVARVRSYDGKPLSYTVTYNPSRIGAMVKRKMLKKLPMLAIIEKSGVEIGDATQTISARRADEHVAALLEEQVGAALLSVMRLVRDAEGRPIQLLQGLYRPDRYEFRMNLSRTGGEQSRIWISDDLGREML